MNIFMEWIKKIVFFYIWITAVMYLLPNQKYQKYFKFVAGLLLVIFFLTPFLNLLYHPDYLLDKIAYEDFWQTSQVLELDLDRMEEFQQQMYQQQWQQVIQEEIQKMALQEEMEIQEIQITFSKDCQIEDIFLEARVEKEAGVFVEKILSARDTMEYPKVLRLKEKIMDFYQIQESQIQIVTKGNG